MTETRVRRPRWANPLGRRRIGIDLGTCNTTIYLVDDGVLLREASAVAQVRGKGGVIAVGDAALQMLGKTPESIEVLRPVRNGVVADFARATELLRDLTGPGRRWGALLKPTVLAAIPTTANQVERRAIQEACLQAGADRVFMIDQPIAGAIGAGLAIEQPEGRLVVDVGGGHTDAAVISCGGLAASTVLPVGGLDMDEAIARHVRQRYRLVIGEQTAEQAKREACAWLPEAGGEGAAR